MSDKDIFVAAVTDNARNMVNAINGLYLQNFPCMGHTLQLAILKAFDIWASKVSIGSC